MEAEGCVRVFRCDCRNLCNAVDDGGYCCASPARRPGLLCEAHVHMFSERTELPAGFSLPLARSSMPRT